MFKPISDATADFGGHTFKYSLKTSRIIDRSPQRLCMNSKMYIIAYLTEGAMHPPLSKQDRVIMIWWCILEV